MTKAAQRILVESIIANVQKSLLEDLPKIPEEWDGRHLRNWIAKRMDQWTWPLTPREQRDMNNEILVRNI